MKAKRVEGTDPAGTLAENAARIVAIRLGELRTLAEAALDPDAVETQHDTRIAAKRLRYVLEVTGFCFGKPAEAARKRAKDLQDLLGDIHDVDVMLPRLRDHRRAMREEDAAAVRALAGEASDVEPELAGRAPHRTAYRGLEVLEVYLLARRELLFERFTALWHRSHKRGVWRGLEKAVADELAAAAERQAAEQRAERARHELEEAERIRRQAADKAERASAALAEAERAQGR